MISVISEGTSLIIESMFYLTEIFTARKNSLKNAQARSIEKKRAKNIPNQEAIFVKNDKKSAELRWEETISGAVC